MPLVAGAVASVFAISVGSALVDAGSSGRESWSAVWEIGGAHLIAPGLEPGVDFRRRRRARYAHAVPAATSSQTSDPCPCRHRGRPGCSPEIARVRSAFQVAQGHGATAIPCMCASTKPGTAMRPARRSVVFACRCSCRPRHHCRHRRPCHLKWQRLLHGIWPSTV